MGVCGDWIDRTQGLPMCDADLDPDLVDQAITTATELLFEASGRQFRGVCTDTIHPHQTGGGCWWMDRVPWRVRPVSDCCGTGWAGLWCAGGIHAAVPLPNTPVVAVDEIVINGDLLNDGLWQVIDYRWLVRTAGVWPTPASGPGVDPEAFKVTYRWGTPPPQPARMAAQVMACELAKGWTPKKADSCRLPKRVSQITREGVTVSAIVEDFRDLIADGFGLFEVAAFLQTYPRNPGARLLAPHTRAAGGRRITG